MAEMVLDSETTPTDQTTKKREKFAGDAFVFGFSIGLIWLLEAIGWLQGGGLSSLLAARREISAGALAVDLDDSTLRAPIMTLLALVGWLIVAHIHVSFKSRWWGAALAIFVFGGGFLIDGICEPHIAKSFMETYGYSRCLFGDHHVGNGKSRIYFEAYARSQGDCLARKSNVP